MRKRPWILWVPAILLALGAVFLPTDGVPHTKRSDAVHSVQLAPSRGPELASMFAIPASSTPDTADARREGSGKTFPLILAAAGMLVVMTGALHLAAWRLAQ